MKRLVQDDVIEQLLRRFNPFGFRMKEGKPYEFMRLSEVYLFLMNKIYAMCPRGYIELPLLLSQLYHHLTYNECRALAESMKPMGLKEVEQIDFLSKSGRLYIEQLCRALHNVCETTFDNANFLEAYRLFENRIELEMKKSIINQIKEKDEKEK